MRPVLLGRSHFQLLFSLLLPCCCFPERPAEAGERTNGRPSLTPPPSSADRPPRHSQAPLRNAPASCFQLLCETDLRVISSTLTPRHEKPWKGGGGFLRRTSLAGPVNRRVGTRKARTGLRMQNVMHLLCRHEQQQAWKCHESIRRPKSKPRSPDHHLQCVAEIRLLHSQLPRYKSEDISSMDLISSRTSLLLSKAVPRTCLILLLVIRKS